MKKTLKKQEALDRMRMLKLHSNVINEFDKEGIINLSEHGGILYWLTDEQQQLVRDFEEKHNCLVYHAIHNYTEFGELLSLLYVSDYLEEWDYDREDIKHNCVLSYVINLDEDLYSEFGIIGIKPQFGGLVRTA